MTGDLDKQIADITGIIERRKAEGESVEAEQIILKELLLEKKPCLADEDLDDEEEEGKDEDPEEEEEEAEEEPEAGQGEDKPNEIE